MCVDVGKKPKRCRKEYEKADKQQETQEAEPTVWLYVYVCVQCFQK